MAPAVLIGASIAGSAISAVGQLKQGDAARQAGEMNAANARQNALDAVEQARLQEDNQRREAKKIIGSARANYGASGVTMEGSPLDVLESSTRNAELDALTIRYGGKLKADAYNRSGKLYQMEGESAQSNSRLAAGGTFLSGITSAVGKK